MHSSLLLGAVLHSCLLYHFVTFEAKFGHIGVNNPYIWWSVYEHEVMIGMFKDLGSLFFNFGSKAVVQSTSWRYLILRQNMAKSEKNSHVNGDIIAICREKRRVAGHHCHIYLTKSLPVCLFLFPLDDSESIIKFGCINVQFGSKCTISGIKLRVAGNNCHI